MNKPRLIDENELIEWLTKPTGFRTNCEDCPTTGCIDCVIEEAIKNTPTAYDIDKVVEQLEAIQNFEMRTGQGYCPDANEEECRYRYSDLGCSYCAFEKAIEIVKGGLDGSRNDSTS